MKGTLHKTESGWQVWYHAKDDLYYGNTGVRILPLIDNGHIDGLALYDSNEGLEVEFEVVDYSQKCKECGETVERGRSCRKGCFMKPGNFVNTDKLEYAKFVAKATRPLTEDDAWPEYPSKLHQLQIKIAEECFKKYPNNEQLYTTDELKNAYKAGVIDGLKEWTLDSYDRPKYPEVIVNPIVLHKSLILDFKVYPTDLGEMSWNETKKACADLGDGWRLPTKEELNLIYKNKDEIGGFADNYYWSSTEYNDYYAWDQYFLNGRQYYNNKNFRFNLRAVRALTKKQD